MSAWRNMYWHELVWILVFTFLGKWQQWCWVLSEINMSFFFADITLICYCCFEEIVWNLPRFPRISHASLLYEISVTLVTRIKHIYFKILFFFTCRRDTASVVSFLVSYLLTQQCEFICVTVSGVSHWPTVAPNDFGYSDGLFWSTF
jgi:hypothetical protein